MPANINAEDFGRVVEVEYDYTYKANDGRAVVINRGEKYVLIKKSNEDWWQVIDKNQKKPFYVPAAYVRESSQKQFLLDHPFFKKVHRTLLEKNNTTATKESKEHPHSREALSDGAGFINGPSHGTGQVGELTKASKLSDLRASTASLDKFIENENPYDLVPVDMSVDAPSRKEENADYDRLDDMLELNSQGSLGTRGSMKVSSKLPSAEWISERNTYGEVVMANSITGEKSERPNDIQKKFSISNTHNADKFEDTWLQTQLHSSPDLQKLRDTSELDVSPEKDPETPIHTLKSRSLPKDSRKSPPRPPNAKLKPRNISLQKRDSSKRMVHSRSMVMPEDFNVQQPGINRSETVEKQGKLNCTKVAEAGKKMKKNWSQLWVVLLSNNLLFYKDQKQATPTKGNPMGKPESSYELRGAITQWAKDKSSKKNVLEVSTITGYSFLLQNDDTAVICEWSKAIETVIKRANDLDPLDRNYLTRKASHDSSGEDSMDENHLDSKEKKKRDKEKGKKEKKSKPPSRHGSDAKQSDKVRSKLKKFIGRRPTMESLQERGLIQETVFGCHLGKLCEKENTTVPKFVKLCVEEVEKRGLKIDGIYRVSGNLSHVQKLRYQIDRENPVNLSSAEWEDIHVVTGALKLFLRELPEPIIPFTFFDKFIGTCKLADKSTRCHATKALIHAMPKANKDTLAYLMQHFCKVVENSESNRMQVQNIAIVFGPTLLLKPPDTNHHDPGGGMMAVYMMYQNQLIDYMISEFKALF